MLERQRLNREAVHLAYVVRVHHVERKAIVHVGVFLERFGYGVLASVKRHRAHEVQADEVLELAQTTHVVVVGVGEEEVVDDIDALAIELMADVR